MYSNRYCSECDVWVHDADTLQNHKMGKPHLKQLQRLNEDIARKAMPDYGSSTTRTGLAYYELPSQFQERIDQFHMQNNNYQEERRLNCYSDEEKRNQRSSSSNGEKRYVGDRSRERTSSYSSDEETRKPRSVSPNGDTHYNENRNKRKSDFYNNDYSREKRYKESDEQYDHGRNKESSRSKSPSWPIRDELEDRFGRRTNFREELDVNQDRNYSRKTENNHYYGGPDTGRFGTNIAAYPVIPAANKSNEYRPKLPLEIKKVNGQFYCEPCDTYCARMDTMQSHIAGQKHVKKTKQITRYACDLCLIEVSSAETLQTHYHGMSHMKRAKVADDAKKEAEYAVDTSHDPMEEIADLRRRCSKLEKQNVNLQKEVDNLIKFKTNCIQNHQQLLKCEGMNKFEPYNEVVLN